MDNSNCQPDLFVVPYYTMIISSVGHSLWNCPSARKLEKCNVGGKENVNALKDLHVHIFIMNWFILPGEWKRSTLWFDT